MSKVESPPLHTKATRIDKEIFTFKVYFEMNLYDGHLESALKDIAEVFPDSAIFGLDKIQEIAAHPSMARAGMLKVIQIRQDTRGNVAEAKGYFTPLMAGEVGARTLAHAAQRALPQSDASQIKGLEKFTSQHPGKYPLYYLSIAYRPELEIEFYHDGQAADIGKTASEIIDGLTQLCGGDKWQDRLRPALEACLDSGMYCSHVSRDVFPWGGGDITLLFDPSDAEPGKNLAAALRNISQALNISLPSLLDYKQNNPSELVPLGLALSFHTSGHGDIAVALEEIHPDVMNIF